MNPLEQPVQTIKTAVTPLSGEYCDYFTTFP